GAWKVDWIYLLGVGLPALLVAITPMLVNLSFDGPLIGFIVGFHPTLVTVAGISFGFVFVSAWSKQASGGK
ncbi:MAG: hypothetical protein PHG75_06170, partial [Syntrophomonas sp.]|nr:hypothetical protein [Syntrophomonas sp.]